MQSISIQFAMVDFTNPKAVLWLKSIIKDNLITEGRAWGWMQDFGEYTPLDVTTFSKEDPSIFHNKYPEDWARITREVQEELGRDDIVAFMRSGNTISPRYTDLFWMGDQLPTLDKYDVLQSAMIGMLNGGLSGYTQGHSDVGGYTIVAQDGLNYVRD